jgi:glycosyltransferase involved in cell wall biosynthesis
MKILMALERDFPPDLRVENEIKSLISYGHSVVLACYTLSGSDTVFDWNGCKVYKKRISKFTYKSSVGALRFPSYFKFWRTHLEAVYAIEKPNAIHIHDLPLARIGHLLKRKYNIKFVLDLHENWPAYLRISHHTNTFLGKLISSNSQWERYELKYCNLADNVIVVIDEAKERLASIGIPNIKIETVANYPVLSDFEAYQDSVADPKNPILFYAGGIAEHRGLQYVVRALPDLIKKHPAIKLWLLGDGNFKAGLQDLANIVDVSEYVTFFGHVPYKTVLQKLDQSTIALIPHEKSEHTDSTIPHKLFQYMYAGKPVAASNCTPIERIVNASNAGAIYEWNSSGDCAAKIDALINSLGSFDQNHVRQQIVEKYNWDQEALKLNQIYGK